MIAALRHQLTRLRFSNPCPLNALHSSASGEAQPEIEATLYKSLVHNHSFPPKSAFRIAAAAAAASANTVTNYPKKSDSVISFLRESGFSHSQLEKMLESLPGLLMGDVDRTLRPKIGILLDFGISATDAAEIISNDPWIMRRSLDRGIIPSLIVLKELLGSNELAKFLKASGWFLKTDLATSLVPNVDILRKCGVAVDQINWMVYHFPRFLLGRPEGVKRLVERVDELGVKRSSRMFIHAVRVLSSMTKENWEIKIRAFKVIGFSEDEVVAAFRSTPVVFGLSVEKLKEVKEVIISSGKYGLPCIVKNPISLMYSSERRYKPRIKVLEALEKEGLIRSWPDYSTFYRMSDKMFYEKYVVPYLDRLGDVCVAQTAGNGRLVVK